MTRLLAFALGLACLASPSVASQRRSPLLRDHRSVLVTSQHPHPFSFSASLRGELHRADLQPHPNSAEAFRRGELHQASQQPYTNSAEIFQPGELQRATRQEGQQPHLQAAGLFQRGRLQRASRKVSQQSRPNHAVFLELGELERANRNASQQPGPTPAAVFQLRERQGARQLLQPNAVTVLQREGLQGASRKPKGKGRQSGEEEEEYVPDEGDMLHRKNWPWWVRPIGLVLFATIFSLVFGLGGLLLCSLYKEFRVVEDFHEERGDGDNQTYCAYLKYRFAYWFVWTRGSNGKIMAVLTVVVCLVGAALYCINTGTNMWSSMWQTFVWLVAPDAGASEATNVGAAHGALMSIVGLVLFALLLTLMQDSFAAYLTSLRNGEEPVRESGHTILIGLTDYTMPIIQELCKAHETTGGTVFCILSSAVSKVDMEQKIRNKGFDMLGSKIVVREGYPMRTSDLAHVAAESARCVVIMPDKEQTREMRDTFVLRAIIALRGRGWPRNGRLLAVCSLVRNVTLFEDTGGSMTDVVMLDIFLGKLMVQCSQHQGLGTIVKSTFGFGDSEFYIRPVPAHLAGRTFSEASLHYSSAVLCGIMNDGEDPCTNVTPRTERRRFVRAARVGGSRVFCDICPGSDYRLQPTDEVVLLAIDACCTDATAQPIELPPVDHLVCTYQEPAKVLEQQRLPEKVLMIGWNCQTGFVVLELDSVLPPKSEIIIVSSKPRGEREAEILKAQKRFTRKLENVQSIQHVEGALGSRFLLEELPVQVWDVSRIFILADDAQKGAMKADTVTIGVLMQIRDILRTRKLLKLGDGSDHDVPNISIIPEIQDPESEVDCAMIQAADFIDTSGLPSQVLAMIAYEPRVAYLLDDLLTDSGRVSFAIRKLQDYIQPGTEPPSDISFFQVQELAGYKGDIVVGWSTRTSPELNASEFCRTMREHASITVCTDDWEMNPQEKMEKRAWSAQQDKLVVLCASAPAVATASPASARQPVGW